MRGDDVTASDSLVLLVNSGTRQSLHHALTLALVALADGDKVALALFYEGLAGYHLETQGMAAGFGVGPVAGELRDGFERVGMLSVVELVQQCREIGGERLRVVGCGAAVEVLGLDIDTILGTPWYDDVVGLPTIWRWAKRGRVIGI